MSLMKIANYSSQASFYGISSSPKIYWACLLKFYWISLVFAEAPATEESIPNSDC